MTELELRELDKWIAEHLFGWRDLFLASSESATGFRPIIDCDDSRKNPVKRFNVPKYTTDPSAAMEVLKKCYEFDRNSCLASFHNFLMRKDHDASLTELQICLFAKQLFTSQKPR